MQDVNLVSSLVSSDKGSLDIIIDQSLSTPSGSVPVHASLPSDTSSLEDVCRISSH